MGHFELKKVEHFKYLGTIIITQKNECLIEIQERINLGNKCFYALSNILRSRVLSKEVKIQLYLTIIRPMVMYGSQCWTLQNTEKDRLHVFERKVLRKVWRKRHSQEMMGFINRQNIGNEIRQYKLEWAGHAYRKQNYMIQ